jgi:hypothetical protein
MPEGENVQEELFNAVGRRYPCFSKTSIKKEHEMNKLVTLASDSRIFAWLCCSVAALLTACGGGASDGNGQQPKLAAYSQAVSKPVGDIAVPGSREEQIADLYWWILGRKPDDGGLQYWAQSGLSVDEIAFNFKRSREHVDQHAWDSMGQHTQNKIYVDASSTAEKPDGTERNPYKTLAAAAKAVKRPGTTIFVKPGIYEGGFRTDTDGTAPGADGTDGGIYWVSTLRWGAKIVPASSTTNQFDNTTAWTNTGNYVQIIGFEVDGSRSGDAAFDNWRQGIYTSGTRSVIRDNYVHDVARWCLCSSGKGGAAINIDAHQNGGLSDAISNWVRDIGQHGDGCNRIQGIYVSSSGSVINNVVYRVIDGAAIHLYHEANRVKVINNTVAASNVGIVVGAGGYRGLKVEHKDSLIYNNIAYDNYIGIGEFVDRDGIMGINDYKNNLVAKNTHDWGKMTNLYSETQTADPAFIGYSKTKQVPNFHLASPSAAISNGTSTYAHETDFDGRGRGALHGSCIGAYEHL